MVKEVTVVDPPNDSGHKVIEFSVLFRGFEKYHCDTKPKERECLRGKKLARNNLWGNVAKLKIIIIIKMHSYYLRI